MLHGARYLLGLILRGINIRKTKLYTLCEFRIVGQIGEMVFNSNRKYEHFHSGVLRYADVKI